MFLGLFNSVIAHGFLIGPTNCETGELLGRSRNYDSISFSIDSLRNPAGRGFEGEMCRGASFENSYEINSGQVCVALAISKGAYHAGPCLLEFHDTNGGITNLGTKEQCLQGYSDTNCNANVPNLVTGDMCRVDLTFNSLNSGNGFLRWLWIAQHIEPNEYYQSCVDVIVDGTSPENTPNPTTKIPEQTSQTSSSPISQSSETPKSSEIPKNSKTPKSSRIGASENNDCICNETPQEPFDSCVHGEQKCTSDKESFTTCVYGKLITFKVPPGTLCVQNSKTISYEHSFRSSSAK